MGNKHAYGNIEMNGIAFAWHTELRENRPHKMVSENTRSHYAKCEWGLSYLHAGDFGSPILYCTKHEINILTLCMYPKTVFSRTTILKKIFASLPQLDRP